MRSFFPLLFDENKKVVTARVSLHSCVIVVNQRFSNAPRREREREGGYLKINRTDILVNTCAERRKIEREGKRKRKKKW